MENTTPRQPFVEPYGQPMAGTSRHRLAHSVPIAASPWATTTPPQVRAPRMVEPVRQRTATALPRVASIDPYNVLVDATPITVTVAAGGSNPPWLTTVDEVRHSDALWRQMHLADWNTVSEPLRDNALQQTLARYRHVLMSPATWTAWKRPTGMPCRSRSASSPIGG